jgi:hypothetical protein
MPTELSVKAKPAVSKLIEGDEDQLFEELGIRARAIGASPEVSGSFDPVVEFDEVAMGPLDAVADLGRRIYRRWEGEAHKLVCGGEGEDKEERQALQAAFRVDSATVASLIAAGLVSYFGLAPAIAAVVAAIIAKRFFRPVYEEFCAAWSERLAAAGA